MILETTYQMYQSFLDGIKKYGTGAVNPEAFNRIINDWGQDQWIKENVRKGSEITQDVIDRLSVLRVITDGVYAFSRRIDLSDKYILDPIFSNEFLTSFKYKSASSSTLIIPKVDNYFKYPLSHELTVVNGGNKEYIYPPYLHLLSVQFKIEYINNECGLKGISVWKDADILRSDNRAVLKQNPFRKPKDDRLYYEILNEHIVLTTGTESKGREMNLDYLRHPRKIFFNVKNGGNVHLEQEGIPDYSGTIDNGSVNCELPNDLRQEIVETAVRTYIERVQDPRYQTIINELNIKNNG